MMTQGMIRELVREAKEQGCARSRRDAMEFFAEEIRLLLRAPDVNGCEMTPDWRELLSYNAAALDALARLESGQDEKAELLERLASVEAERDEALQCIHNIQQALSGGEVAIASARSEQGEALSGGGGDGT